MAKSSEEKKQIDLTKSIMAKLAAMPHTPHKPPKKGVKKKATKEGWCS